MEAEYRLGLKDLAFEHCAKVIRDGLPKGVKLIRAGTYLSNVFPNQTDTAEVWWTFLRQKYKEEANAAVLKRVRNVIEGKVAAKEVKAWIVEADGLLSSPINGVLSAEMDRQGRAG